MSSSRHTTFSSTKSDDDDEHPPPPYQRNLVNATRDRISDKDSETQPLLRGSNGDSTSKCSVSDVPARYVLAIWAFFGFFCLYAMRVNLSVAIVAMVSWFCFRLKEVKYIAFICRHHRKIHRIIQYNPVQLKSRTHQKTHR